MATSTQSSVLANDTDPNGYTLTAVQETNVQHGTLTLNSNGTFAYTPTRATTVPTASHTRPTTVTFTSTPATVTITVKETAPVANNGSFTVVHDRAYSGAVSATDAESDPLTASVVTNSSHGVLALNPNGTFTYTPNLHYVGADSFTYKVSDGILTSSTGTITLTVVDSAPVAYTNYFTTAAGQALNSATTPAYGVQYLAYDADGDHPHFPARRPAGAPAPSS